MDEIMSPADHIIANLDAEIARLRNANRKLARESLSSQAQMMDAYEAQLKAEAELARLNANLSSAMYDAMQAHLSVTIEGDIEGIGKARDAALEALAEDKP